MSKLRTPITLETAFASYTVDELLGEGGAGRVYGGSRVDGGSVAIKVLTSSTAEKKRRFKNETHFLLSNTHPNIVKVLDYGLSTDKTIGGPFYVMSRYNGSLRDILKRGIAPDQVLNVFGKILDGVEAAHLRGVVHRDLKPENILCDPKGEQPAIADFGIASFTEEFLATAVETGDAKRLANFVYAAPEQRMRGAAVGVSADLFALGLILNEMFTGTVPHGTEYKTIAQVSKEHAYLDQMVGETLRQNAKQRPISISALKAQIQRYAYESVNQQKLSALTNVVVKIGEIDDPLAKEPPKLAGVEWAENGIMTLTLDKPVHKGWIEAFRNMGNFTSVMGIGPNQFTFQPGGKVIVTVMDENSVQRVINHFKEWLPTATRVLHQRLVEQFRREEYERKEKLRADRESAERRLRVNREIKI